MVIVMCSNAFHQTGTYLCASQLAVLLLDGLCLKKGIRQEVVLWGQRDLMWSLLLSARFLPLAPHFHVPVMEQQHLIVLVLRGKGRPALKHATVESFRCACGVNGAAEWESVSF